MTTDSDGSATGSDVRNVAKQLGEQRVIIERPRPN
jgi:hypothetical protein